MNPVDGSVDGHKVMRQAHDYLLAAVRGVPADGWGRATPCSAWTVRQVLNHARLDQLGLVAQIVEVAPDGDPFEPVDALGPDPVGELERVLATAQAGWASVGPDAEDVPTPFGPVPGWLGMAAAALDAGVHAWDIARATGQDLPLTDELAAGLQVPADRFVDFVRDTFQKYAPAVPVSGQAGAAARLLAFTGRDPEWTP
ncbi:TIGR03086 family protein [Streptomyces sp. SID8379]|uniref:TIGR03086 family metal-binding protein n=1 Tax=unclassified Streptomyces TaxID=2593676 RepID=UPI0003716BA6|nr:MULTISPECIES: TIGR03086 family metal-binding protein [unclassified Streptomyces]MYW62693.1 TIGR03086 family protein [Streptomyces sp. SID8379]